MKIGFSGAKPLVLALGRASDESLPQARRQQEELIGG
jgi:hypothetical protein